MEYEYKLATINLRHYLDECSDNKNAYFDFNNRIKYYMMRQKRVGGYYKFNENFATTLNCYGDDNNLLNNFKFNYDEFISKLMDILNVTVDDNSKEINKNDLIILFEERLSLLNDIMNRIDVEELLKKEFPIIYKDYKEGDSLYRAFNTYFDFTFLDPPLDDEKSKTFKEMEKNKRYYYACGLRFHIPYFIKKQYKLYNNLVHGLDLIEEYTKFSSFLDDQNINQDKKELYLINEYVNEALKCDDIELKKVYISLFNNYLMDNKNKDICIHDLNGNEIRHEDAMKKIHDFIALNKELNKYLVDWILIPNGDIYSYDNYFVSKKEVENNSNDKDSDSKTNSEIIASGIIKVNPNIEKYIKSNNRKLMFYEHNPHNRELCLAKALGLFLNKGYIAYIYKNGEVILDTVNDIKSAYGNAIYNLNVYNFETLSKLDKHTLRKEKLCPIIPHTKHWEDRIQKIIDKEIIEENYAAAKKLIKRIKYNNV